MFWLSWWSIYKFKFEVNCFLSRVSDLTAEGKMCFASIIFLMTFFFPSGKRVNVKRILNFFSVVFFSYVNLSCEKWNMWKNHLQDNFWFHAWIQVENNLFSQIGKRKIILAKLFFFPLLEVLRKFVSSWSTFCVWSDLFTIWEK